MAGPTLVPSTRDPSARTAGAVAALRRSRWLPAFLYAGIAAVLAVVTTLGARFPRAPLPEDARTGVPWLDAWVRYDAGWYRAIALDGYSYTEGEQSSVAFFPAYPMAMRALTGLTGDVDLSGVLVTLASGAGAVLLFRWWTSRRLPPRSTSVAVALLLLYPYSLYLYGAVYADALFLLTALGAFVLLERGHPWLAGLVGALATAGRPVGLAVVAGLAIRTVEISAARRSGKDGPRQGPARPETLREFISGSRLGRVPADVVQAVSTVRWRDAGVLLSLLGLVGYSTYQAVAFGNPLAFVETQGSPGWDQGSGPRTWFKVAFVGALLFGPPDVAAKLCVAALFCAIGLLLLWRVRQRFGWGYAAYALLMVAVPAVSTKDFMGTGRYLIAAFPLLAVAGDVLAGSRRRWVLPVVLAVLAGGLVLGAFLFGTGYQVS